MNRLIFIALLSLTTLVGMSQKQVLSAAEIDSMAAEIYRSYDAKLNPIIEQFSTADSASQLALVAQYTNLSKQCNVDVFKVYASHANKGEYYIEMMYHLRMGVDKEVLQSAYDKIKGKIRSSSPYAASIKKHLTMEQVVPNGDFLNFEATMASGDKIKLSEIVEMKNVLLIFGVPSMETTTLAMIKILYSKIDYSTLEVIAFSTTATDLATLNTEIEMGNKRWVNVSDFKGDHSDTKIAYGVQSTPTFVLIEKGGKVSFVSVGASQQVFAAFAK